VAERDFDVLVFGATGVTGRRVAQYLATRGPELGLRCGAAARDAGKLADTLAAAGAGDLPALSADLGDQASLERMAASATVVLNLVGPYTLYGEPVIAACVRGGAHYVDLTGEIPFVRAMIDRYEGRAVKEGVKVVQVCGFEALPPDLAVALADDAARAASAGALDAVDVEVRVIGPPGLPHGSDMLSGGTIQSMVAIAGSENAPDVTDPALLIDSPALAAEVRRVSPIRLAPRRGGGGAVIGPMAPAAFINPAVIHRSWWLRDGTGVRRPFRYREGFALDGAAVLLPLRYAAAGVLSGTQAVIAGLSHAPPDVRARIAKPLAQLLPGSGFGPAESRLEGWRWELTVVGTTTGGSEVRVRATAEGHPGYLATARMMGEAGLMLATPGLTPERSGCLTPTAALGTGAVDRFAHARLWFETDAG
jgi:short subunit dehydrogenase-like uncharacterized protein